MLKAHRQTGGGVCGGTEWKPTLAISCLLLILICVCILHSFVIFHLELVRLPSPGSINGTGQGSPRVVLNRGPILYALREEQGSHKGLDFKGEVTEPVRLVEARGRAINVAGEERTASGSINGKGHGSPGGPILYREEQWRHKGLDFKGEVRGPVLMAEASGPSLDKPPVNVTEEERIRWFRDNFRRFKVLRSDSLSARFPAKTKAFFQGCKRRFFMTWISRAGAFGPRELASVESVFRWHPDACLLVISRTLDSVEGSQIFRPFADRGFRVMAAAPDLGFLFKGTPAEAWLRSVAEGATDPGEIPFPQNLSNILRLAALYKYGGIYIDSDVILLRRFARLRNAIGAQNTDPETGAWNRLNNAVLVFDKRHPLVFKFIQEFALTFNGNKWGHNGPYLVTRVVSRIAKQSNDFEFVVMPPLAFYPVDWTRIHRFFKRPSDSAGVKWRGAKLSQLENETFAIHLWNKQSREFPVEDGSIIHHIFNKSCIICHHKHFPS
uniref:Alpha 1,4-glycosyltransferase domain-containing protein n=1 Tax=Araucaria cunninghamii TaxID=56994 RepID=A0A0D6R0W3_ARACU